MSTTHNVIPNQSPTLVVVSTIFFFITTLFFGTRLIWRLVSNQRGWDDLMASLAYITLVIQTSFGYLAAHYGFGKHRRDIPTTFPRAMFWFWLYQICYKLLGGFTKLNFCFLYLRIFDGSGLRKFQVAVWVTGLVITVGTLAFTIGTLAQCIPVEKNWNHAVPGHCNSYMAFWFSHAAFNTVMDIVVYILPVPLIRTLRVARRTKIGLFAIFVLGAFTISASIVRMAMLPRSARSTSDPTWGSMSALIWTEVEANTAVICCCLPALRVLAVKVWRKITGKSGGDETSTPTPKDASASKSKGWGGTVTTTARYSPDGSADYHNDDDEDTDVEQLICHRRSPAKQLLASTPPSSPSSLSGGGGAGPPKLELPGSGIYKTTQLQISTNRESMYEMPKVRRDIGLRQTPPLESITSTRVGDVKGMTLKEMLDEDRPATSPAPVRLGEC